MVKSTSSVMDGTILMFVFVLSQMATFGFGYDAGNGELGSIGIVFAAMLLFIFQWFAVFIAFEP